MTWESNLEILEIHEGCSENANIRHISAPWKSPVQSLKQLSFLLSKAWLAGKQKVQLVLDSSWGVTAT